MEPWQAERVSNCLKPTLDFLHRLRRRMDEVDFDMADDLVLLVSEAADQMEALVQRLSAVARTRPERRIR